MGHPTRRLRNNSAESNLNSAQDVSEGKNIINWARDYLYDILAKNIATFLPLS